MRLPALPLAALPLLALFLLAACDSGDDGGEPIVSGTYVGSFAEGGRVFLTRMTLTEGKDRWVTGTMLLQTGALTDTIGLSGRHAHPNVLLSYYSDVNKRFVGTVSADGRHLTGSLLGGPTYTLTRQ